MTTWEILGRFSIPITALAAILTLVLNMVHSSVVDSLRTAPDLRYLVSRQQGSVRIRLFAYHMPSQSIRANMSLSGPLAAYMCEPQEENRLPHSRFRTFSHFSSTSELLHGPKISSLVCLSLCQRFALPTRLPHWSQPRLRRDLVRARVALGKAEAVLTDGRPADWLARIRVIRTDSDPRPWSSSSA